MAVLRTWPKILCPKLAAADLINGWLAKTRQRRVHRQWVTSSSTWGGVRFTGRTIEALAQPYRFYLLQRVQDDASLSKKE